MSPAKFADIDAPETQEKAKKPATVDGVFAAIKKSYDLKFFKVNEKTIKLRPVIKFGVFGLDHDLLGVGGAPKGRIIEVYGPESSGKTTLLLQLIAETQKAGGLVAFVDAEHALDPAYAKTLGVDIDNLFIAQPDYGEQALQAVDALVDSGLFALVVVDSVAALVPKAELDGEIGDAHVGLQARMMGQTMRMIAGKANKTGTIVAFINQIREKVGVTFGSNETTSGGRALRFAASVRIDIRRIAQVKRGENVVGNKTKIKIVKLKVAAPHRSYEGFELLWPGNGVGVDNPTSVADYAIDNNVVKKSGAYYKWRDKEEHTFRSRAAVIEWLTGNEKDRREVEIDTLRAMGKSEEYIEHHYGKQSDKKTLVVPAGKAEVK